ncbi:MAG: hypothetical protein ABJG42_24400 [Vibrio splendidus]
MALGLSDDRKAFALIAAYLKEPSDKVPVYTDMPIKLTVKRRDGAYRVKMIPEELPLFLHDAYMSKKGELLIVFEPDMTAISRGLEDVAFVEIPHKLISSRLEGKSHDLLIKDILHVTNGEISKELAYSTPIKSDNYSDGEFGSW